jgi:hypothetical protein
MTLFLSEYISGGEIINTRKNSVHGYLAVHGSDRPVVLQLTGNCRGALEGRHLQFEMLATTEQDASEELEELRFAWMQIGVTGEMSLDPEHSKVFLEWFGQHGRTIVELEGLKVEFIEEEEDDASDSLSEEDDADIDDDDDVPGAGSTSASFEPTDGSESLPWDEATDEAPEPEDPFGLFPSDLGASLNASVPSFASDPDEATLAQWKEWDEVFDGTKDVPLSSLFDPPIRLPPAETLDDPQVESLFQTILAQLARHNVAFHMCEHYTPRMGYVLLVEEILKDYGAHPELPRIGYTMNFDTSEHCEECAAKFDREFEDYEKRMGDRDDPDLEKPSDDLPF